MNYAIIKVINGNKEEAVYEVKLSNDIDLEFDKSGKFLRIDD